MAILALTAVGAEAALAVTAAGLWDVVTQPGATPDQAIGLVAAGLALALILWLMLSTVAAVLAHLPGRCGVIAARVTDSCAPTVSRRLAGALIGMAAVSSVAPGVASAARPAVPTSVVGAVATADGLIGGDGPGFSPVQTVSSAAAPSPGWRPSRPPVGADAGAVLLTPVRSREREQVVVRRGDTLWDLARRDLGHDAPDAEVAEVWPQWYAANRQVIGPDPGRLRPGQILRRPGPNERPHDSRRTTGSHR